MKKHGKLIKRVILTSISLLLFICGAIFYVSSLKVTLLDELKTNLSQTADSTGKIIEENVKSEIHTISSIAAMLENTDSADVAVLVAQLTHVLKETKFLRLGVADLNGNCYTTDDQSFDVSTRDYYQASLKGKAVFSKTFQDVIGKKDINVFSSPIYHDGVITNVLFASIETEQLSEKLLIETYDDYGFSEVINEDGDIIIQSSSPSKKQQLDSIAQLEFLDGFQVSDIKENEEGVAEFITPNGEHRYLAYHRLDINDWYIVSIVPSSIVSGKINHFLTMAMITWFILAFIFAAILLYIYIVRTKADKKMEELVFFDDVTNHYNYNRFRVKTQKVLDHHLGNEYSLIEMDIKDFKLFNEFYGYQGGDHLLKTIMDVCDASCSKTEACSRITADRFILLLHTRKEKDIIHRMNQMIQTIEKQLSSSFHMFNLTYKIGIYLIEENDTEFSKCHDRCAYAKKQINDTAESFSFFSKDMYQNQLSDKKMESLMEAALQHQEFEVYLQPKVTLVDQKIHAAEALVRWNSPVYGLIPPGNFIPLFERNGFLERLDKYMVCQVCKILEKWKKEQRDPIIISVNLSRVYLFKPDFVDRLIQTVEQFDVDTSNIEFEITESVIFDRSEELQSIIKKLKRHGFSIAMDDFGSGYSSLNMLKDIPIDVMKLDQEFFRYGSGNMERSKKIIESVILLAKGLQIHTVAEGVEQKSEVDFLKNVGCDEIQGFYYAKPLPLQEFIAFYETFSSSK